ncbi:MAG: ShlB/FhaC/HecB family hemolysin secretion/activation protein [Rickettsiales bacterium]
MPNLRFFAPNTLFYALTTSALIMIPVAASAALPVIPDTARPETVGRQLQFNQRPEVSNQPSITMQEQDIKELKGDVAFVLNSISFEGDKKLESNELGQFYNNKIGTKVTLAELNAIAAKITAYYRNKGLILTRAIVPPQRIAKGAVKIQIIEGFVSEVQLTGDVGSKNSVLYKYAEKIKASKPLDAATLERYLLLMEDLPGVEARAVLQPSPSTPGASQVIVNIKRRMLEGSTVYVNNRGTRFLGPVQTTAILAGNNVLGQDEQTSLRVISTPFYPDELKYFGARHEEQLGSYGTKAFVDGSFVATTPGYNLEAFNVHGQGYTFEAGVSHPIIRSRQSNWFVNSDFSVQRSTLSALDTNLYLDHLRVLKTGTTYDFTDSTNAVNRLEGNISKGFNWNTGNDGLGHSRANGKASFWKTTANITRLQPVHDKWSIFAAVDGQYSLNPLYAAEEYALGGQQFGSAFDSAELSGDSAIAGRVELQYNGISNFKNIPSYQPYGFYDIGKVWNRNITSTAEAKTASLASAGAGVRLNMEDNITGSLELAFPLTRKFATAGDDGDFYRIFFNLQYRY